MTQDQVKVISAPYHPYNGACIFLEIQGENNTIEDVRKFVKEDPYVVNGLVSDYKVDGVVVTHIDQEFERVSYNFMTRT